MCQSLLSSIVADIAMHDIETIAIEIYHSDSFFFKYIDDIQQYFVGHLKRDKTYETLIIFNSIRERLHFTKNGISD